MPYLVGEASKIVDDGDRSSFPDLNDWSNRLMSTPDRAQAMFWGLLLGATLCRDQAKFDAWQDRAEGMYFDEILRLFRLAHSWLIGAARERVIYSEQINIRIDSAARTSDRWTTLSQLTVAVLEVVNRDDFRMWMLHEEVRDSWLQRFESVAQ